MGFGGVSGVDTSKKVSWKTRTLTLDSQYPPHHVVPNMKTASPPSPKAKVTIQRRYDYPMDQIHEAGAKRHGGLWMAANMRAIDVATYYGLTAYQPGVKEFLSEITLRLLDGLQVEKGKEWSATTQEWVEKGEVVCGRVP